jgi:hypothetical protein
MVELRRVVALVATAMVLGACTSSSSSPSVEGTTPSSAAAVSAATYAETVCGDLTTWKDGITGQASSFQQDIKGATSPDEVKTALEGFLGAVVDDTTTMVADIEAMGAPDVEAGTDAHATLTGALRDIGALFQTALDDVKALDTSNPQALASALQGIGTDLQTGSQDMQDALDNIDNAELDAAFNDTPSCSALQS